METNKIYNVDFKEYIKNIKDKSIDLVVTVIFSISHRSLSTYKYVV